MPIIAQAVTSGWHANVADRDELRIRETMPEQTTGLDDRIREFRGVDQSFDWKAVSEPSLIRHVTVRPGNLNAAFQPQM